MDSTYKTDKYGMPLFEIVGETSTEETYSVGFAFMSNEKENNFMSFTTNVWSFDVWVF
jgi:hypothetical protein